MNLTYAENETICNAVKLAEKKHGKGKGNLKREMAIQICLQFIPFPKWLPKWARRFIIGLLIDFCVYLYNRIYGKFWGDNINKEETL